MCWSMSENKKTEYDALRGTDVFEFFILYDNYLTTLKKLQEVGRD